MDKRNELHGGHRERLRQRLMTEGVDNFEPHELLEFLLYYAIPRQNVNLLAHELLNTFGNLRNVLGADPSELTQVKGMGENAALWLNHIGRCIDICSQLEPDGFLAVSNLAQIIRNLREMAPAPTAPCLMQYCLNRKGGLLYRRILCTSREWGEAEILREGMRDVFSTSARYVILVLFLNDEISPTPYDIQKVEAYAHALRTAESTLRDLILFHGKDFFSFNKNNLIPELLDSAKENLMREEYLSDIPAEP